MGCVIEEQYQKQTASVFPTQISLELFSFYYYCNYIEVGRALMKSKPQNRKESALWNY